ncbi:hypothetical protein [Flavobacterium luteum]|uniref:Uncharacterized protein n=1 Tax=Flavobacterium luteum TaxID=2026654 RepID=A0A7J5AMG5_9FLAO|nr:hypothetical protein [Flavobacterium luteum]KAB1158179.1 hypothetical protein F6464_03600 [Flavobacterium luteum]
MKHIVFTIIILLNLNIYGQKPCEISTDVTDSIGKYKSTKEYLVYEKNFNEKSSFIFASFVLTDKIPILNLQFIEKSKEFIKAKCFDSNSKLYLQLMNSKIITLSHTSQESCGTLLRDAKGFDNRILTGYFLIKKENFVDLKNSPVSFIRIKYSTENEDYIFKKELKSELNATVSEPESFFINYLHCIE